MIISTAFSKKLVIQNVKQKCCSSSEIFDCNSNNCVSSYRTKFTAKDYGFPTCSSHTEVLVELNSWSESYDLIINENKSLTVSFGMKSRNFTTEFYCADVTATPKLWMVSACWSKEICHQIPCIRRCCGDGRVPSKDVRSCQYRPHYYWNIPFTNSIMDTQHTELDASTSLTHGMLSGLNCTKFMDEAFELDTLGDPEVKQYIDRSDGSLYLSSTKKRIQNDRYCLAFTPKKQEVRLLLLLQDVNIRLLLLSLCISD